MERDETSIPVAVRFLRAKREIVLADFVSLRVEQVRFEKG